MGACYGRYSQKVKVKEKRKINKKEKKNETTRWMINLFTEWLTKIKDIRLISPRLYQSPNWSDRFRFVSVSITPILIIGHTSLREKEKRSHYQNWVTHIRQTKQQQQNNKKLKELYINMSGEREKNVIHWFRKGLRLHDNPALKEALKGANTVRCVYTLDPWFAGSSQVGINKWR